MDKMKRYINCVIPVTACNLRCHYCYITQVVDFAGEIKELPHSVEYIGKALSAQRMGGPCFISVVGLGETMLAPYIVDLAKEFIQQGNYVSIVTNALITRRLREFCDLPASIKENLCIHISMHYLELKRQNLLAQFVQNVHALRDAGISFFVTFTASDDAVGHIEEIKQLCLTELGALCHINESRSQEPGFPRLTKLPIEEHIKIWDSFGSDEFSVLTRFWGEPRREFCYAGDWFFNIYLENGALTPCASGGAVFGNAFENIDEPIRFASIGSHCPWGHCYGAHCWMALGVIPEIEVPVYSLMRNRVCSDGTNWLQPKLKYLLSSKFTESNVVYSQDKQDFINALMAMEYGNASYAYSREDIAKVLEKSLLAQGFNTVAIFGTDRFGNWLRDLLRGTRIRVKFIVDHERLVDPAPQSLKGWIKRRAKYWAKRLVRNKNRAIPLKLYDKWPKIDAIVVSPYARFDAFQKMLSAKTPAPIISITELVPS